MKRVFWSVFCALWISGIATFAYADRRSYVWTYEYMTLPKGMAEVEFYVTNEVPDTNRSNVNTWKHLVELEYGLTDHWDVAMYQMWKQTNTASASAAQYDGFKLRTRYRFAEKGQWPLDTLLYLEYIRDDDFSKPNVGEFKLILAKDIGRWNVSYNQIMKRDLENAGKTGHEYAAGIGYELFPAFKLGIESKGNYPGKKYALGPVFAVATKKFWVTLGAVFGLNRQTDDVQSRVIVGIPF